MSKDFTGGRRVDAATNRLTRASYSVAICGGHLTRRQLRVFGRRAPRALRGLREVAAGYPAPDELEVAARRLTGAVEWSPAKLPEDDPHVVAFAARLLALGSAIKSLDVARRVAAGEAR